MNKPIVRRFLLASCMAFMLPLHLMAEPMDPGPEHCGMPHRGMGHEPPFLHGLNLSDEQRDKLFQIFYAQMPRLHEQEKLVRKSREDLDALASSGHFDETKAQAIAQTGATALTEMAVLRAEAESRIYALLTPEQRRKAESFRHKIGR